MLKKFHHLLWVDNRAKINDVRMLEMDQLLIGHYLSQQKEAYLSLPPEPLDGQIVLGSVFRLRANKRRFEKEHFAEQVAVQSLLMLPEQPAFQDVDVSAKVPHVLSS